MEKGFVGGYVGTILYVDLSTQKVRKEQLDERFARTYIGGKGFGARTLYDILKPRTDPLSPENVIAFMTGPLTGTAASMSGRHCVTFKSPLTGIWCDSGAGGDFGPEMKFAGYDGFVISGASKKPVYLWVDDDEVEIKDGQHLWGMNTHECVKSIRRDLGDEDIRVATIGQAGENLVRYACISYDLYRDQAGRGGGGAVMGSKKLKAVAVRGRGSIEVRDIRKFEEVVRQDLADHFSEAAAKNDPLMTNIILYGTVNGIAIFNEYGLLPTRNFFTGEFEGADKIRGEVFRERVYIAEKAGFGCPVPCAKLSLVRGGPYAGTVHSGPEYESVCMLGSNCGIDNPEAITKASLLCDEYGIDTISAGVVIGFAMECYEKGIISKEDTNGIELFFGNCDAQIEMIRKIALREGIGNLLAEGVKRVSEKLGKGTQDFAIHVKGMELPGYEPRGTLGMALAFATSDRGGCHLRCWPIGEELFGKLDRFSTKDKATTVFRQENMQAMRFTLGTCEYYTQSFHKLLSAATGWDITMEQMLRTGERIYNLTRAFNTREHLNRKDDTLPRRLMEEPMPSGPSKGHYVKPEDLNKMLDEYYAIRGWGNNGIPTRAKLHELGLSDVARDLEREGYVA